MTFTAHRRTARRIVPLCAVFLFACGDDAEESAPRDAGMDAGSHALPDVLMRRDAAVGADDPIPPCNRATANSCPAGQRCAVVARRAPDATGYSVYEGCVNDGATRAFGDPCSPFGDVTQVYRAPGLTDEVHVDTCGDGFFCAASLEVRGANACQRSCASSNVSGYTLACAGAGEFCSGTDRYQQVCRKSDGCNPADLESCGAGRGCYLRVGDDGASALSICLPLPDMPIADGASCIDASTGTFYLNACGAGASCWGPIGKAPTAWDDPDYLCRRACDPEAGSGADAGDEDGGVGGACPSDTECIDFRVSGLDTANIDGDFGHCE